MTCRESCSGARAACKWSAKILATILGASALCSAILPAQNSQVHAPVDASTARQMHDAIAAAQSGDETHAIQIVRSLVAQHPRFTPALKLEGMLLEDTGQAAEAAAAYEAALALSPNDPELLLKAGAMDLLTGKVERATGLLNRRLSLLPADEDASYYLAQAWHLQGDNDRAIAILRAALRGNQGHPATWQKLGELLCSAGRYEEALQWLIKAQQANPSLQRVHFDLAVAQLGLMNLKEAAEAASEEASAQPRDLDNLMLLATVEIKLADYSAAGEVLQRVVGARPNDAAALVALGHCEVELKQYPAAIETLQSALQTDPTQTLSHFFLSRAYAGLGEVDKAQHETALYRELQQHLAFAPSAAEAKRNDLLLQQARTRIEQHDEEGALRLFREDTRNPTATAGSPSVLLGSVYLSMGRTDDARRSFQTALRLDPKTPDANAYLGNIALEQGDLSNAESHFDAERGRDSNHVFATAGLGAVRYRQQRWKEAADLIARSKTTDPTLLFLECDALFHLEDPQRAVLVAETVATYGKGEAAIGSALDALLRRNGQTALADQIAATSHRPPL